MPSLIALTSLRQVVNTYVVHRWLADDRLTTLPVNDAALYRTYSQMSAAVADAAVKSMTLTSTSTTHAQRRVTLLVLVARFAGRVYGDTRKKQRSCLFACLSGHVFIHKNSTRPQRCHGSAMVAVWRGRRTFRSFCSSDGRYTRTNHEITQQSPV